jgi:hypothetical protein
MIDDHIALINEPGFAQTADKCAVTGVVSRTVLGAHADKAHDGRRAFAATGHAAAPPSAAMKVRRRIHPSRTERDYHYGTRMAKQFSSDEERVRRHQDLSDPEQVGVGAFRLLGAPTSCPTRASVTTFRLETGGRRACSCIISPRCTSCSGAAPFCAKDSSRPTTLLSLLLWAPTLSFAAKKPRNNAQLDALVDGVVWFTADPNPLGMFAKPWDRSDCRITCIIPVRDKRLMHWRQWLRKNLPPDQHQQAMALNEQAGTPWRSYWIYFGPVPRDYLRAVEYADPDLRAQASAERQRDPSKFMNPS